MKPLIDYTPTGSRSLDIALNILDAVIIATLLAAWLLFGKKPRESSARSGD